MEPFSPKRANLKNLFFPSLTGDDSFSGNRLEDRVLTLEKFNQWFARALEKLAPVQNLAGDEPGLIRTAESCLKEFIDFRTSGFFLIEGGSREFYLAQGSPPSSEKEIHLEIDRHIEKGNFAWALNHQRVILSQTHLPDCQLLLHAISSPSGPLGMFAGWFDSDTHILLKEKLGIVSIILSQLAFAIENGRLTQTAGHEKNPDRKTVGLENQIAELRRDAGQAVKTREKIEAEARLHKSFLDSLGDGVFALDLKGSILYANPGGARMSGFTQDKLKGKSVPDLFIPEKESGPEAERFPLEAVLSEQTSAACADLWLVKKNGSRLPVDCSIHPIREEGVVKGAVMAFRDARRRKQNELDRKKTEEELRRSNQELEVFASVASHDLKEPLRKMSVFSDRLMSAHIDQLDEKGRDYLQRIINSTERMETLIEDLLHYSRLNVKPRPFEVVSIEEVVQEAMADLEPLMAETKGEVKCEDLPSIEADRIQLYQLFLNLIGNGLKFKDRDRPPVVRISCRSWRRKFLEIRVEDNGVGFETRHAERVFRPFERLQGRSASRGSGMGLAICKKIVLRHEGEISAESEPGKGSRFLIRLPKKQIHPQYRFPL